jgi:hypothetical protein
MLRTLFSIINVTKKGHVNLTKLFTQRLQNEIVRVTQGKESGKQSCDACTHYCGVKHYL